METLTEMVKSYLDSQEWHYRISEAKEVDDDNVIYLGFDLEHESVKVFISLDDKALEYRITCNPELGRKLEEDLGILKAINQYNCKRAFIKLALNKNNDLCFVIDGIILDLNQEKKFFVSDFNAILENADNENAQILRHAEHKSGGVLSKIFGK